MATSSKHRDAAKGKFKRVIADKRLERNPLDNLVSEIASSADGSRVAIGAASGKIHIFRVRPTGRDNVFLKLERSLDPIDKNSKPPPYSLVFDPRNHDRLIAAYMPSPRMALWNIDRKICTTLGDDESGPVWRVAFDPKGELVASATNDGVIRLWPSSDHASPIQLHGHLSSVFAVDISPKNGIVASGSFDGTIRLWTKNSLLAPSVLSNSTSMVAFDKPSATANNDKYDAGRLPKDFGQVSAGVVSADKELR
jgi:WD40 repeat protein